MTRPSVEALEALEALEAAIKATALSAHDKLSARVYCIRMRDMLDKLPQPQKSAPREPQTQTQAVLDLSGGARPPEPPAVQKAPEPDPNPKALELFRRYWSEAHPLFSHQFPKVPSEQARELTLVAEWAGPLFEKMLIHFFKWSGAQRKYLRVFLMRSFLDESASWAGVPGNFSLWLRKRTEAATLAADEQSRELRAAEHLAYAPPAPTKRVEPGRAPDRSGRSAKHPPSIGDILKGM